MVSVGAGPDNLMPGSAPSYELRAGDWLARSSKHLTSTHPYLAPYNERRKFRIS
jgi:hypothetical protein